MSKNPWGTDERLSPPSWGRLSLPGLFSFFSPVVTEARLVCLDKSRLTYCYGFSQKGVQAWMPTFCSLRRRNSTFGWVHPRSSAKILVLDPQPCTRIWICVVIGLFKKVIVQRIPRTFNRKRVESKCFKNNGRGEDCIQLSKQLKPRRKKHRQVRKSLVEEKNVFWYGIQWSLR